MRKLDTLLIEKAIEEMFIKMNYKLGSDMKTVFELCQKEDCSPIAREIFGDLLENGKIAEEKAIPLCQDTGMAVVFIEIGQEVQLIGKYIGAAINDGVRAAYENGYLRKSVVKSPLERINTGDNTPAVIHYEIVPGDKIKITGASKGFGSENMSQLKMLTPAEGIQGVMDFVVRVVAEAGSNPCPPMIVGVGLGGTLEKAAILSKKALLRDVGNRNNDQNIAALEETLLEKINELGIGAQGLGGSATAFDVHVETYPTHIAGLPVAVNINCHSSRHMEVTI